MVKIESKIKTKMIIIETKTKIKKIIKNKIKTKNLKEKQNKN